MPQMIPHYLERMYCDYVINRRFKQVDLIRHYGLRETNLRLVMLWAKLRFGRKHVSPLVFSSDYRLGEEEPARTTSTS